MKVLSVDNQIKQIFQGWLIDTVGLQRSLILALLIYLCFIRFSAHGCKLRVKSILN